MKVRTFGTVLAYAAFASTVLAQPVNAQQALIPGLFSTGVDSSGTPLTGGSVDPHYSVVAGNIGSAFVVTEQESRPGGYAQSSNARWIWWRADGQGGGTNTFRLSVDLTGFDLSSVAISGQYGGDDNISINLNGTPTGFALTGGPAQTTNFTVFHPFTLTGGFVPGINHLDFIGEDIETGAINVNSLSATARATATPEPGPIALLLAGGLTGAGWLMRRRRKQPQTQTLD